MIASTPGIRETTWARAACLTGFVDLDERTSPACRIRNSSSLPPGRASAKLAFSLNVARHIAIKENIPIFFVSLEQSRIELAERLICVLKPRSTATSYVRVDWVRMTWSSSSKSAGSCTLQPVLRRFPWPGNAADCRQRPPTKTAHGIKLTMIDYLQLIETGQSTLRSAPGTGCQHFATPEASSPASCGFPWWRWPR